jgi:hypothetical protein
MHLIVAGGRDFNDYSRLSKILDRIVKIIGSDELVIISGAANGADNLAIRYARESGIKLIEKPANWNKYGKRAGYIRNREMADIATHLLAFWDGKSKGTANMISIAESENIEVMVCRYEI